VIANISSRQPVVNFLKLGFSLDIGQRTRDMLRELDSNVKATRNQNGKFSFRQ